MKRNFVLVLACASLIACSKENDTTIVKLVDETVWSGEFKYSNRPFAEPFSIEFDGNGNYVWYEANGPGSGTYTTDEATKTVTLTLTSGNGFPFAFRIEGNNRFGEVTLLSGAYYTFLNGSLIKDAGSSLDNTTWGGTINLASGDTPYELKFKPLSQMSYMFGTSFHTGDFIYQKKKACLYYEYASKAFGIIKGDSMIGVHLDGTNYRPYRISKK